MRQVGVLLLLVCGVWGRPQAQGPQDDGRKLTIISYDNKPNTGNGEYYYSYELSDGTRRWEEAQVVNPGTEQQYLLVRGGFPQLQPDGSVKQVEYYADDQGYHSMEDVLPPLNQGPPASLIASLVVG